MERTADGGEVAEVTSSIADITLSSSSPAVIPAAGVVVAKESKKKEPVDLSGLTDQQVMLLLQEKERRKFQQRLEKAAAKENTEKDFKFWNTQPVLGINDTFEGECGPIEKCVDVSTVKQEPYNMPKGFEWCSLDMTDPAIILEVYNLLSENYVEDDGCLFRFDYSVDFLQWALTPPGFLKDWHVGVRNSATGTVSSKITRTFMRTELFI